MRCILEKSQTKSAREAKLATAGLQTNSVATLLRGFGKTARNSNATQPMREWDAEKDSETTDCIGPHRPITQHCLSACHRREVPKAGVAGGQGCRLDRNRGRGMDCLPDRGQPGTLRPESWRESFVVKMMPEVDSDLHTHLELHCTASPDSLSA